MMFSSHPGADWADAIEARNDARRQENTRVAEFYNRKAKEQEELEAAQVRAEKARSRP